MAERLANELLDNLPEVKNATAINFLSYTNAGQGNGAATGRNPVSIVVPCHRVVGSRGEPCTNRKSPSPRRTTSVLITSTGSTPRGTKPPRRAFELERLRRGQRFA